MGAQPVTRPQAYSKCSTKAYRDGEDGDEVEGGALTAALIKTCRSSASVSPDVLVRKTVLIVRSGPGTAEGL